jgi:hypothetical protein
MVVVMVQDKTMLARTNSKNVPSSFTVMLLDFTNDQLVGIKAWGLSHCQFPISDCRLLQQEKSIGNCQSEIGNRFEALPCSC